MATKKKADKKADKQPAKKAAPVKKAAKAKPAKKNKPGPKKTRKAKKTPAPIVQAWENGEAIAYSPDTSNE